jgi:hypothetical protein
LIYTCSVQRLINILIFLALKGASRGEDQDDEEEARSRYEEEQANEDEVQDLKSVKEKVKSMKLKL